MHTGYRFGDAELLPDRRLLLLGGQPAHIGARAFDLLLTLVERRDRVVGKHELLDCVWPGLVVEENNLQVHVSALRKMLGPGSIATVPGRGYRFIAPVQDASEAPAPMPPGDVWLVEFATADGTAPPVQRLLMIEKPGDLAPRVAQLLESVALEAARPGSVRIRSMRQLDSH